MDLGDGFAFISTSTQKEMVSELCRQIHHCGRQQMGAGSLTFLPHHLLLPSLGKGKPHMVSDGGSRALLVPTLLSPVSPQMLPTGTWAGQECNSPPEARANGRDMACAMQVRYRLTAALLH